MGKYLFGLVVSCFLLSCFAQDDPYRLSGNLIPSAYTIDLTVAEDVFNTASYYDFSGVVGITFTTVDATSEITLHRSSTISILSTTLTQVGSSANTYTLTEEYNSTLQFATFTSSATLTAGTTYLLTISYNGVLEGQTMRGFYKSSYTDANGDTVYLVTTQFEPTSARFAFPSFDEPDYKATFEVSITHPASVTALCNTANSSIAATSDPNVVKTSFYKSPVMSTYLVAFIVSVFTCSEGDTIEQSIPHRVCSRPEEESARDWAVEIGPPLMRALESITGIKYGEKIGKMDQIALPDFSSGAMENWGLVTYRETGLLWDSEESSNGYKKSIATVIAHEFTHMWFGNLVTCKWWDYLFLNEGFARFYQYFAGTVTKQLISWELDKHFNVEQVHTALLADSYLTSQALTSAASTPTQISNKFSTISYNKGASILRMIETAISGPDNFIYGIRKYLTDYDSLGATPANLWSSLANYVSSNRLPSGVSLSDVLENWVEKSGHPVVTVTTSGNDVILSQQRFLLTGNDTTEYYVPISYTVSSDISKFSNTTVKAWLVPGSTLTLSGVLDGNSWIILNNRQSGFYRVNYDSTLWSAIKTALHANHLNIDVLNRAQIVSDAYNFGRAGASTVMSDFSYKDVLDVLRYLEHEVEYYPWYAAIIGNNHILTRIGYDSTEGKQFSQWMLNLLEHVYSTVPFDTIDNDDQVYTMKQVLILGRVCKYGESTCITKSKELFADYRNNGNKVPKNLRAIVYCNALRNSDDVEGDYNFLWSKYEETKLMSEILTIFSGLGCSADKTILKGFLAQSINASSGIRIQDFSSVWSYVYANSDLGMEAALEFIKENYDAMNSYYSGSASSLVGTISGYLYSTDQLSWLEDLYSVENLSNSTVTSAIDTAKGNIEWASSRRLEISEFLVAQTTGSGFSYKPSILVACVLLLLQRLL
uniref:Aminopeptidase n=1 Tax=Sitophilus oryzae TaxID=7048 RepID=D9J2G0_SITOR|nr:aminopeptidase N [Sitophilus oryzae]